MPRLTPAVVRTLDILELFLEDDTALSAPDVVRLTGVPRTTAHELLATLVARDYLQRDESTNTFRLGVRLLQLGNAYSARFDMLAVANEAARELSASIGETVSVALREGADVFYLAKVEARDNLRLPSSIGQRLPANVTGLGKVLLAYVSPQTLHVLFPEPERLPVMTERSISTLPELEAELTRVRERGVAFEREESTPGIMCVAAPVRDSSGAVVAAISTSVPVARWQQRAEQEWVAVALHGAAGLSAKLGFVAPAA
jgi:IclR family KDG regulon transcriptional repressor